MQDIWSWIEWIGNTLIFLLAGLITGHKVLKSIYGHDWLILFCLFLIVTICRFVTVGVLYPLLKRLGYGMTPKEAAFIRYNTIITIITINNIITIITITTVITINNIITIITIIVTFYLLIYEYNCRISYNINYYD
jgi:hypothetical protein